MDLWSKPVNESDGREFSHFRRVSSHNLFWNDMIVTGKWREIQLFGEKIVQSINHHDGLMRRVIWPGVQIGNFTFSSSFSTKSFVFCFSGTDVVPRTVVDPGYVLEWHWQIMNQYQVRFELLHCVASLTLSVIEIVDSTGGYHSIFWSLIRSWLSINDGNVDCFDWREDSSICSIRYSPYGSLSHLSHIALWREADVQWTGSL